MPTNFPEIRMIVFDLDGTLIDSKSDLVQAVNATRRRMNFEPLPDDVVSSYVGEGMQKLIERAMGEGITPEQIQEAMAYFLEFYHGHMLDFTVTYPGVREGLAALEKAFPLAVLTNKPVKFSQAILDGLGLSPLFRRVYGGNSFERKKPDPTGMNALLDEFRVRPREVIFVGDSIIDMQTARNAGTWAVGVSYGFGSSSLHAVPPDVLLDSITQLPPLLETANGR